MIQIFQWRIREKNVSVLPFTLEHKLFFSMMLILKTLIKLSLYKCTLPDKNWLNKYFILHVLTNSLSHQKYTLHFSLIVNLLKERFSNHLPKFFRLPPKALNSSTTIHEKAQSNRVLKKITPSKVLKFFWDWDK